MRIVRLVFSALAFAAACGPPPEDDRVFALNQVEPPRLLNDTVLARVMEGLYPRDMMAAGVEGEVEVSFVIGPNGVPRDAAVLRSTRPEFEAPSLEAVKLMRFKPAIRYRRPVAVRVDQPIHWTLVVE
ncbi:MAG TPA: energy transducer TonB [Longimicrobium sp.]|nr:energy transducer TonB [Longimicrobium sp.]